MARYNGHILSHIWSGYVKKNRRDGDFFINVGRSLSRILFIPIAHTLNKHNQDASIINLQIALPQNVKPPTRFRKATGTCLGILFGVAAHRDCPFHRDLTRSSLLL